MYFAFILLLMAFSPLFGADFTNWDDPANVWRQPETVGLSGESFTAALSSVHMGHFTPLTRLSYAVELRCFGLNPGAFHADNFFLHLLNVFLVFYLLSSLTGDRLVAFLASMLFGLHPIQVETVAWVSARNHLLYASFALASTIFYVKYLRRGARRDGSLSFVFFAASLFSLALAVSVPLFFLFLNRWLRPRTRVKIGHLAPFFAASVLVTALTLTTHDHFVPALSDIQAWLQMAQSVGYAALFYPIKIAWPAGLSVLYPPAPQPGHPYPWLYHGGPLLLGIAVAVCAFIVYRRRSTALGPAFYLSFLLPALPFLPFSRSMVADRYAYLPAVGLFVWIAVLAARGIRSKGSALRVVSYTLVAVTAIGLTLLTHRQAGNWRDSPTLWGREIEQNPGRKFPLAMRGDYYCGIGDYSRGIADYDQALDEPSGDPALAAHLLHHRGNAYFCLGRWKSAADDYRRALAMDSAPPKEAKKIKALLRAIDIPCQGC